VLTATSTLFPGLNQQLAIPDHLAKATICVARLRALEMEMKEMNRDLGETTIRGCGREHEEFMF
jgi:hypothetical protein